MKTIAQKRARINGWIKTYEARIEKHKSYYGERSRAGKLHIGLCRSKIASWKKSLDTLTHDKQINKSDVTKFLYDASCTYFDQEITFPFEGGAGSLGKAHERYYFSKLIVDLGLCCDESCIAIGATKRPMYARRNVLTKSKDHKQSYRAYKTIMEQELKSANIQYR